MSLRTSGLARKLQTVIRLLVQQITSNALGGGWNDSFLHLLAISTEHLGRLTEK
jgi:hypothetical protein